jgi:hypothetical protein
MNKDTFLTKKWNNWLTFGFGIPAFIYAGFVLTSSTLSDFTGWLVMVLIGATY